MELLPNDPIFDFTLRDEDDFPIDLGEPIRKTPKRKNKSKILQKLKEQYHKRREFFNTEGSPSKFPPLIISYLAKKLLVPHNLHKDAEKVKELTSFLTDNGQLHGTTLRIQKTHIENSPFKDIIKDTPLSTPDIAKREKFISTKLPETEKLFAKPEHNRAALMALRHIKHYNMPINKKNAHTRNWKDLQTEAEQYPDHPLNSIYIDDGETKLTGKQIIEKLLANAPRKEDNTGKVLKFRNTTYQLGLLKKLKDFTMSQFKDFKEHGAQNVKDIVPYGINALKKAGKYLNSDVEDIKFAPLGNLVNKGLEKLDSGADNLVSSIGSGLKSAKDLLVNPGSSNVLPREPKYSPEDQHKVNASKQLTDSGMSPNLSNRLLHGIDLYVRSKRMKGLKIDPGVFNSAIGLLPGKGIKALLPPHMDILREYAKNKHGEHFLPESRFDTKFNNIQQYFNLKPEEFDRKQAIKNKFKALHTELMTHQNKNGGKIAKAAYNSILDKHFGDTPAIRGNVDKAIREGFTKKS